MKLKRSLRAGFTLLEIMLVVLIISLLIGLAITQMGSQVNETREVAARSNITTMANALELYNGRAGFYPTTAQGLEALVTRPNSDPKPRNWAQALKEVPRDPWDNAYVYKQPGDKNPGSYDLYSLGADRKDKTGDEIGNWKTQSK